MKMMKTILPLCLLATVCIPAAADDQERAFGKGGLHGTRSGSTQNKQPSKQQLWQNDQSYALALAKRAENGDTTAALELKNAANGGNRWAAVQYGYLAHTGRLPGLSGRADTATAAKAYRIALKDGGGNYLAAYNLGLMYYYGIGMKANGAEALRLFKTAAENYRSKVASRVFWPAEVYTAQILERGYGVAKNEASAAEYWERAAKANAPEGLYGYGMFILNGRGGLQNPYRAYPLLLQAANRWHTGAMVALAQYQGKGDRLRDADPVDAAKWWMLAATADKRYTRQAQKAVAALPAAKQQQVHSQVRSWLTTHTTVPKSFDWKKPVNDTLPPR